MSVLVLFCSQCKRIPSIKCHDPVLQNLASFELSCAVINPRPARKVTASHRFDAAADAVKREDEERVQQVTPAHPPSSSSYGT